MKQTYLQCLNFKSNTNRTSAKLNWKFLLLFESSVSILELDRYSADKARYSWPLVVLFLTNAKNLTL